MRPYLTKTPNVVQRMFPKRLWRVDDPGAIYLTFDDGPIPELTPWVLDQLKQYDARATFFCIGRNIDRNPEIFERLRTEGHTVANHTQDHLNGWQTSTGAYLENMQLAAGNFRDEERYFRPPYGKISSAQARALQEDGYRIVMWDVLSYDFDRTVPEEKCLENTIDNLEPGSIVVFHDSKKAERNLRYALPRTLEYITEKGWKCRAL